MKQTQLDGAQSCETKPNPGTSGSCRGNPAWLPFFIRADTGQEGGHGGPPLLPRNGIP